MSFRNSIGSAGDDGFDRVSPTDKAMKKEWPAIHEFLAEPPESWEGEGSVASISIFVEDGKWKACLSDKASSMVCFSTGISFSDALQRLDKAIQEGTADWRKKKQGRR